jgi:RNA polymerase sigma factor (TIGR02999 family)
MSAPASNEATQLLLRFSAGDQNALNELLPLIYDELTAAAQRAMRHERPDHTLQTTALVHEAYLRLVDQTRAEWRNRAHFCAIAAQVMRRILVDHARAQQAAKRSAGPRAPLEATITGVQSPELAALDEALTRLGQLDPRQARVVELRYFGGLSIEETAEALDISPATVKREWTTAKAWLRREMLKS